MSERKVLNKYYPPDYDPSKIPKLPKGAKSRQWVQRVMAPFNMRCNTCGEYIARAKKFNMRREKVVGEDYLGLMIFRFYLRCPRCVAEITFKTDLKNCDYEMEHGATRNFMAQTLIKREEAALKEEKANEVLDPMTVLENRTKDSQKEMAMIDTLEELQEMTRKSSKIAHDDVIDMVRAPAEVLAKREEERQEAEDEAFVRSIFGGGGGNLEVAGATQCEETPRVKRLQDSSSSSSSSDSEEEEDNGRKRKKKKSTQNGSEGLSSSSSSSSSSSFGSMGVEAVHSSSSSPFAVPAKVRPSSSSSKGKQPAASWNKSVGSFKKSSLGLVKKKSGGAGAENAGGGGVGAENAGNGGVGIKAETVSTKSLSIADKTSKDQDSHGKTERGRDALAAGNSGSDASAAGKSESGASAAGKSESDALVASRSEDAEQETEGSPPTQSTGLLGLGAYSDSDESE